MNEYARAFLLLVFPSLVVATAGAVAVWAHGKALDRSAVRRRQQQSVQGAE
jgi:hypothetical protein